MRPGGVVIERTFADALGVTAGDRVSVGGKPFTVAGIAVTAAQSPYPNLCNGTLETNSAATSKFSNACPPSFRSVPVTPRRPGTQAAPTMSARSG